jgi:chemotaxis response regulator CheB
MGLLVGLRVPRSATRFEVIAHPIYAGPVLATPPAQRLPMLHQTFPIAGIGASAGGVEALEVLFQDLPPDSGMAFVLVTHLPVWLRDVASRHPPPPQRHGGNDCRHWRGD